MSEDINTARDFIYRLLDRMKRINGDPSLCIKGENWGACENHILMYEAEEFLRKTRPKSVV